MNVIILNFTEYSKHLTLGALLGSECFIFCLAILGKSMLGMMLKVNRKSVRTGVHVKSI